MYLSFFGLNEKPFAITPDPRYLYLSARHEEALAHLAYVITEAGGFVQLTGEVGTGKTTTIRSLLARAPKNAEIALIINPCLSPVEFVQTICEELGLGLPDIAEGNLKDLIDVLNRHLLRMHAEGRREVHRVSGGIPRVINIVCDRALLAAYTGEQHQVSARLVRESASEVFGRRLAPSWLTPLATVLSLMVLAAGAWALWQLLPRATRKPAAAPASLAPSAPAQPAATVPAPRPLATLLAQSVGQSEPNTALSGLLKLWQGSY